MRTQVMIMINIGKKSVGRGIHLPPVMFFNSSLMIGGTLTNVSTDFTLQALTI
jgi:hypothetical protein